MYVGAQLEVSGKGPVIRDHRALSTHGFSVPLLLCWFVLGGEKPFWKARSTSSPLEGVLRFLQLCQCFQLKRAAEGEMLL